MVKLMKYEFIHSLRSFALSFGVFLLSCIVLPFFMEGLISGIPLVTGMVTFGYVVLVMGLVIALYVSIVLRFNESMFKKPAYLNLTLPVSSLQLILSKLIVSFIWIIIGMIVLLTGVLLTAIVTTIIQGLPVSEFLKVLPDLFERMGIYFVHHFNTIALELLIAGIGIYYYIISVYFSMSVVHTKYVRKHRGIMAFIVWVLLGFLTSNVQINSVSTATFFYNTNGMIIVLINLVVSVVLTIATVYIFDHKIEIE